jgi:hypothetical protein
MPATGTITLSRPWEQAISSTRKAVMARAPARCPRRSWAPASDAAEGSGPRS